MYIAIDMLIGFLSNPIPLDIFETLFWPGVEVVKYLLSMAKALGLIPGP